MNDPAINDKGELCSVQALADLFARRDITIIQDTIHGWYAIKRGRYIESQTAKEFIQLAKEQGIVKQGYNAESMIRAWWHVNRPRR